jgi:hypothetical protein
MVKQGIRGTKRNRFRSAPRRMRNVAAGFVDEDGIFHPLRASFDYSASRAGEGRRGTKPTKKARKKSIRRAKNPTVKVKVRRVTKRGNKAQTYRGYGVVQVTPQKDGTVQVIARR